jgi:hypothetical protein
MFISYPPTISAKKKKRRKAGEHCHTSNHPLTAPRNTAMPGRPQKRRAQLAGVMKKTPRNRDSARLFFFFFSFPE